MLFNILKELIASIILYSFGFIIAKSSPAPKANVRKEALSAFLFGRPNEIFETPNIVFTPSVFTIVIAFIVSIASSCCAETVNDKQSINISFGFIP